MDNTSWNTYEFMCLFYKHRSEYFPGAKRVQARKMAWQPKTWSLLAYFFQGNKNVPWVREIAPQPLRTSWLILHGVRINLAYQELYLVTAAVFRKYDLYDGTGLQQGPTLALYETIRERDVDMRAELVLAVPARGSKGVRVLVRSWGLICIQRATACHIRNNITPLSRSAWDFDRRRFQSERTGAKVYYIQMRDVESNSNYKTETEVWI